MDPDVGEPVTSKGKKNRRYCFTLNNYTEEEYDAIVKWMSSTTTDYAIVGKEVGKNKTPHLQGYVRFPNARSHGGVRDLPGMKRSSLFFCRGEEHHNREYCSKDGDFKEFHPENYTAGKKGKNLDEYAQIVLKDGNAGLKKMIQENPKVYVLHGRGFRELIAATAPKRHLSAPPKCVYAWGVAGSGKSTLIHKLAEEEAAATGKEIYYFGSQFPWADAYNGEEIIVIDDIRDVDQKGVRVPLNFMTRMIDVWPHKVQVKGLTSVEFYGSSFYMSSVFYPNDIFNKDAGDDVDQFLRRITELYHCTRDAGGVYSQKLLGNGRTPRPIIF